MTIAWAVLVACGLAGALTFVGLYAFGTRDWHRSAVGRNLMAGSAVLAGLFALTLATLLAPLPTWLWLGGLLSLDVVLWWRVLLLWQAQHTA